MASKDKSTCLFLAAYEAAPSAAKDNVAMYDTLLSAITQLTDKQSVLRKLQKTSQESHPQLLNTVLIIKVFFTP
jgi:hypothetical protein